MARISGVASWYFPPKRITLTIDRPLFKGPKPLAGREQVVAVDSGGWLVTYEDIPAGGVSGGIYEVNDLARQIALFAGHGQAVYVRVSYGQATPRVRYNLTSNPSVTLTRAHSKRATTVYFRNPSTTPLKTGDYFEIDGRIHQILYFNSDVLNTESSAFVWPPLRAAYTLGAAIEIYDPRLLCYIQTDSRGNSYTVSMGAQMMYSVDFVEAGW